MFFITGRRCHRWQHIQAHASASGPGGGTTSTPSTRAGRPLLEMPRPAPCGGSGFIFVFGRAAPAKGLSVIRRGLAISAVNWPSCCTCLRKVPRRCPTAGLPAGTRWGGRTVRGRHGDRQRELNGANSYAPRARDEHALGITVILAHRTNQIVCRVDSPAGAAVKAASRVRSVRYTGRMRGRPAK